LLRLSANHEIHRDPNTRSGLRVPPTFSA